MNTNNNNNKNNNNNNNNDDDDDKQDLGSLRFAVNLGPTSNASQGPVLVFGRGLANVSEGCGASMRAASCWTN